MKTIDTVFVPSTLTLYGNRHLSKELHRCEQSKTFTDRSVKVGGKRIEVAEGMAGS